MPPVHLNPARLPLGTKVGPWRVLERRGLGAHGAVYRAVGAETESRVVALKLALHPGNQRFARERELLSRVRHPGVPRLVDHGEWQSPGGPCYPFLAMEWVDGVSLYAWARERGPTSRQVLQVLARLARALEATHAAGGVHRDVKGDNVLVSEPGGRAFLTDFGSGHFVGAASLTQPPLPPGTTAYRPPEAWDFLQRSREDLAVPYAPTPADDLFALGVSAYRLVTDEYPGGADPAMGATFPSEPSGKGTLPSARALNARCCEELDALVCRMLSERPEDRGSARELAEALEGAALEAGPEADVPLFVPGAPSPMAVSSAAPRIVRQARARPGRAWLTVASVGATLAVGATWLLSARPEQESAKAHASVSEEARDGGAVAVGDQALTAPRSSGAPSAWSAVAEEVPPKPFPGQRRPDSRGRCPGKVQVPINGGCWLKSSEDPKNCDEDSYVHQGACYTPVFKRKGEPTSNPTKRTDEGPP